DPILLFYFERPRFHTSAGVRSVGRRAQLSGSDAQAANLCGAPGRGRRPERRKLVKPRACRPFSPYPRWQDEKFKTSRTVGVVRVARALAHRVVLAVTAAQQGGRRRRLAAPI